ncbi:MAG TPA: hypothetical protein VGY48_02450 [Vicinamibacterales bacterium]|jgi:hypothetical protein|nr:hypothetical protein [Vicinamibacterales bacterium]
MRYVVALLIGCALTFQVARAGAAPPTVADSFRQLRSLAGDWRGTDEHGQAVRSTFQLIASGTAVMETLAPSGMEEMVTLYSVDRDAITLVHFCPTNNRPRMRAIPRPGQPASLVFEFQDAGNLESLEEGHEHKLVIDFKDQDHVDEHWTWRRAGADTEMIFRLARTRKP